MGKVVVNGDYLAFDTFAGVSRFATELLNELDKLSSKGELELLCPEYVKKVPLYQNIAIVKYGNELVNRWKHTSLPRYIKSHRALLVDLTQAFPLSVRGITCVHDCIPELVDTAYTGFKDKCIKKPIKLIQRKLILKRSLHILTVSDFSKKDLVRIYKVDPRKITVVHNAWQHIKRTPYDSSILDYNSSLHSESFYFTLGSRVPHKNIEWIIAAAKANPNDTFVVSGENKYCTYFNQKIFPVNIIFTGYISDGAIRCLMHKCKAFILPSFYEGFGIPPMEALAEGAEIIISSAACLPEIYGESAHYIEPGDYKNVILDEILKSPVKSGKETLDNYSWENSAKLLYDVIRQVKNK